MLELYRFKDLKAAGYGDRNTVKKNIKKGDFPEPAFDDGSGHPVWTREQMEKWKASRKPYVSATPEHLQDAVA